MDDKLIEVLAPAADKIKISDVAYKTGSTITDVEDQLETFLENGLMVKHYDHDGLYISLADPQKLQEHFQSLRHKEQKALVYHLIPFLSVNSFLVLVNVMTSPEFLWFLFPAGGWGIGLASHWAANWTRKKYFNTVLARKSLDFRSILKITRFFNEKTGFNSHLAAYLATIVFLLGINLTFTPGFLWALIVAGSWGIGLLSHYAAYYFRNKQFLAELKGQGVHIDQSPAVDSTPVRTIGHSGPQYQNVLQEAQTLVRELRVTINQNQTIDDDWKTEMNTLLDEYQTNLSELASKATHVDSVLEKFSVEEITRSKGELQEKLDAALDGELKAEYEQAIAAVDKQHASIMNLSTQKDKLEIKMQNAILALKQMHIELARLESVSPTLDSEPLETLRQKSQEMGTLAEIFDQELSNL
ncbi:2TM domain-containing protein [candidate division CSSED10-310 bacterium]|uniref:2TM domain-containing protein n=1 Tax=candidate division CSSED10-310 bacterium TaxID=2855610 RepID=A0ABV6Z3I4_UNCC1